MTTSPLKFRNILGNLTVSKLYGGEHLGVTAPAHLDLRAEISKIGKALVKFYEPAVTQTKVIQIPPQLQKVLPNAFCEHEGQIYRRTDYQLELIAKQQRRIRAAMSVAKILDLVLRMQQYEDEKELAKLRQILNQKYDDFIKQFGYFTSKENLSIFKEDPNYYRLRALEIDRGRGTSQIGEPAQQIELAKASGWGTLTDIWVGANHQGNTWQYRCYERLCQLLTTAEIQSAKSATATAYQTSFEVIRAMWDLLAAIGFTGGSILEPACNTLSFMGCQPQHMRIRSQWVGVELDPTFAQIARLLYPEAQIYAQGFEKVSLSDSSFDLAIGNVPFGNYKLFDSRYAHLQQIPIKPATSLVI